MKSTGPKIKALIGPVGPFPQSVHRVNTFEPSAAYGSFQGAMPSTDRGYVYFPNLDTEKELDSWSRRELMKRARALYNNIGLVKRIINGVARMVCGTGLMPQAMTSDEDWNDRAERLFQERAGSKNTFHLARRFDFYSSQRAVMRAMLKDGDVLAVLARTPSNALRTMLYEAHQVGNGTGSQDNPAVDGVWLDAHRAADAYSVLDKDGKGIRIPAENALLTANFERIGQVRGATCLYHAVNRLQDRSEIQAALTAGIKRSAQIGYAIETQLGSTGVVGGPGAMAPRAQTVVQTSAGPVTMDKLLGGGEVEELKPGQSFKILHDARPHPNVSTHLDAMVRDIALGTGFFPEVLWNVAELKGANTRFVMADTQGGIEEYQELLVEHYCGPLYLAWIADAIAQGDLPYHPEWYQHGWLTPGRLTVDFGRDGKLHIEQYRQGLITLKSLYGYRGEEWKRQIVQYLNERAFMKSEAVRKGLTLQEAFPNFFGTNVGTQPAAESMDPPEPVEPDEDDGADDTEDPEEEDA